jgi:quercetin dioxygenase-like cupin family protein
MAFRTLRIDEIDPIAVTGLRWHPVRHALGVRAFGVNAYSGDAGDDVIEPHTEDGSDHEEMYVVLSGRARFELDQEPLDAPAGTVVFLPDPLTHRYALAEEDGTLVLALGGKPDHELSAWEWRFRAQPHIDAEEWEKGIALMHDGLVAKPGDASLLYNLACFEAKLERFDDAARHLQEALDAEPESVREWADGDTDLDPLRERADWPL